MLLCQDGYCKILSSLRQDLVYDSKLYPKNSPNLNHCDFNPGNPQEREFFLHFFSFLEPGLLKYPTQIESIILEYKFSCNIPDER